MSASIAKYRRSIVPWVLAAFVCLGIIATVLLSNDKKHLRAIFAFYEISWPFDKAAALPPPVFRQKPMAAPRMLFDIRLVTHDIRDDPALFTRMMPENGPALCAAFAESGIVMDGPAWGEDPFDRSLSGCQSITLHEGKEDDEAQGASSLFIDVKGRASGQMTFIRMKLVVEDGAGGTAIREKAANAFTLMMNRAGWADFAAEAERIRRLEEFSLTVSGMSVSMKREPSSPSNFNIFIQQTGKSPALLQARQYFDKARHLTPAPATLPLPCPCLHITGLHITGKVKTPQAPVQGRAPVPQ